MGYLTQGRVNVLMVGQQLGPVKVRHRRDLFRLQPGALGPFYMQIQSDNKASTMPEMVRFL